MSYMCVATSEGAFSNTISLKIINNPIEKTLKYRPSKSHANPLRITKQKS